MADKVYPKQSIKDARARTDSADIADAEVGYGRPRTRVQARLGDNNARALIAQGDKDNPNTPKGLGLPQYGDPDKAPNDDVPGNPDVTAAAKKKAKAPKNLREAVDKGIKDADEK